MKSKQGLSPYSREKSIYTFHSYVNSHFGQVEYRGEAFFLSYKSIVPRHPTPPNFILSNEICNAF